MKATKTFIVLCVLGYRLHGLQIIQSRTSQNVKGKTLQLESVKENNGGLLIRRNANNGKFRPNTSSGFDKLHIIQHPISQNVSEGENVTFECELNSPLQNQFRFLWRRFRDGMSDETIVTISNGHTDVRSNFQDRFFPKQTEFKYRYQLFISGILHEDKGKYYCEIDDGKSNKTAKITRTVISSSDKAELNVYDIPEDPMVTSKIMSTFSQHNYPISEFNKKYVLYIVLTSIGLIVFGLFIILMLYTVLRKRKQSHKRETMVQNLYDEVKNDTTIGKVHQCTTTRINTEDQPYKIVTLPNVLYSDITDHDEVLNDDADDWSDNTNPSYKHGDDAYDNISCISVENPIYN